MAYVPQRDGTFQVSVIESDHDPVTGTALVVEATNTHLIFEWDNRRVCWRMTLASGSIYATGTGSTVTARIVERFSVDQSQTADGQFNAPMPGVVLETRVKAGQVVVKGETLIVLEGMKMEHHVTAPADGAVTELLVAAGDQVDSSTTLLAFEPASTA